MAQRGREGAMSGRQIMTADEIRRATIRISHEIVEKQAGTDRLVLVGIQRRGVPLARRIAAAIADHEGVDVPVGALDITFYRDDLSLVAQQPLVKGTDLPFEHRGRDGRARRRRALHRPDHARRDGRPASSSGGRAPSASRSSSIAAIASCRSAPTMSARTCRRRARRSSGSTSSEIDGEDGVDIERRRRWPAAEPVA